MAVRKIESTQTLEEFRLEFNAMTEFDFGDIGTLDPSLTATTVIGAVNELSAVVSAAEGFLLEDASSTVQSIGAGQTMRVFGVANQTTAVVSVPDTLTVGLTNDVTIPNSLTVGSINIYDNVIKSNDSTQITIEDGLNSSGNIETIGTISAGYVELNPTIGVGAGYIRSTHPQKLLRIDALPIFTKTLVFEGDNEDSNETALTVTEPTGDRTITFPDETGTVALTSDITGTTGYATSSIFSTSVSLTIYDSSGTAVKTIFGSTT
tara:strand:- start:378 stop:1169 length:792 start_codon:yes stop_codon:yes gene_type:complete